ncbi:hypothetical protein E2C01_018801 [Portunus trituberculatus]|uniref:Uncharacterized protein n=1 Tax=Portunus trituberculatus TaxID=210409 RepID=A0A5B7DX64_PORTR|nr:hypothetical protein [Portunus trituberculatus]
MHLKVRNFNNQLLTVQMEEVPRDTHLRKIKKEGMADKVKLNIQILKLPSSLKGVNQTHKL